MFLTFLTACLIVSLSPPRRAGHDADKCGQMQKDANGSHRTSDDLDAPREPAWVRRVASVTYIAR